MTPNPMFKYTFIALCGLLLITGCVTSSDETNGTADTIYTGGNIITINDAAPRIGSPSP